MNRRLRVEVYYTYAMENSLPRAAPHTAASRSEQVQYCIKYGNICNRYSNANGSQVYGCIDAIR